MNIEIVLADYHNSNHGKHIVSLLNSYALDEAGGGKELSQNVKENLVSELAKLPFASSLICYVDDMPAGLANCFSVFSSFKCKPVVNIHDLIVDRQYRRQGISQMLLGQVEKIAKQKGACKITLEVLEKNYPARNSYQKFGFTGYELKPEYGNAIFLEKEI